MKVSLFGHGISSWHLIFPYMPKISLKSTPEEFGVSLGVLAMGEMQKTRSQRCFDFLAINLDFHNGHFTQSQKAFKTIIINYIWLPWQKTNRNWIESCSSCLEFNFCLLYLPVGPFPLPSPQSCFNIYLSILGRLCTLCVGSTPNWSYMILLFVPQWKKITCGHVAQDWGA